MEKQIEEIVKEPILLWSHISNIVDNSLRKSDRKLTGLEVQRNPYKYLWTQSEIMNAYALLPKFILEVGIGTLWGAYHLRRFG